LSVVVASERIELPIEGMTCASCASRIERTLNGLEGVSASVNYATEKMSRLRRLAVGSSSAASLCAPGS
jgi:cation transport ATPase